MGIGAWQQILDIKLYEPVIIFGLIAINVIIESFYVHKTKVGLQKCLFSFMCFFTKNFTIIKMQNCKRNMTGDNDTIESSFTVFTLS